MRLRKAFVNNSSANIKLSETQLLKIRQSRGFLGRLLGPLLKTGLPLLKNILKPLAKSILLLLGLIATATDATIHKKIFGSGTTTLMISEEVMNNIMKIVTSLEESGLSIKGVSETIQNKAKKQEERFKNICNYFKNMVEESISQEFRSKNIHETTNYFLEEIKQNELMSRKHRKVCTTLNYIEHFLILASTITGCISISAFASLLGILIGITSSEIGFKICAIAAGIRKYKSIIKKKKKKHDQIVLVAKSELNSIEVLIFKALID